MQTDIWRKQLKISNIINDKKYYMKYMYRNEEKTIYEINEISETMSGSVNEEKATEICMSQKL
jgi:hypothetical protein